MKRCERDLYSPCGTKYVDSPDHVKAKMDQVSMRVVSAYEVRRKGGWNKGLDEKLIEAAIQCDGNWKKVQALIGASKTLDQCLVRWREIGLPLTNASWSEHEDEILRREDLSWTQRAQIIRRETGQIRLAQQCRDRWGLVLQHQQPEGELSPESKEDDLDFKRAMAKKLRHRSRKERQRERRKLGKPVQDNIEPNEPQAPEPQSEPPADSSPIVAESLSSQAPVSDKIPVIEEKSNVILPHMPASIVEVEVEPTPVTQGPPKSCSLSHSSPELANLALQNGEALVWVEGFTQPYQFTDEDLYPFFSSYGAVAGISLGKFGGASVVFKEFDAAPQACRELDGTYLPSLQAVLRVRYVMPSMAEEEEE